MYLLYVDESGDTGPRGSTHLILAGAALFEGKWRRVRTELEGLLARFFPTLGGRPRELHAAEVRKGRSEYSALTQDQRTQLLSDACALLSNLRDNEISLFGIVVDKAWWFSRNSGRSGDDLYLAAFEDLISRFDQYLKRRYHQDQPSKGLIIADPRHEAFSRALRHAVLQFHVVGTQWASLQNIVESVLFLPSHESPGIQMADLTAYALWRAAEIDDTTLALKLKYCFDREEYSSSVNPGKWHGIRYHGPSSARARHTLAVIWPAT